MVLVVTLGVAAAPLDTAVNIALPAITTHFAISVPDIQWLVICYILTYACLLLSFGRWADIRGHRQVFVLGLFVNIIGLVLCSIASSYQWLIVFRILQGIGTAMLLATGPALVTLAFPAPQRGQVLVVYNFLFAACFALGPLLGGILIEYWGWPATFWFRLPLLLIALLLFGRYHKQEIRQAKQQRFDVTGSITLTLAIVLMLLAINRIVADKTVALLFTALAIVLISSFILQERRIAHPLINLSLFTYPVFVIANIAHALSQSAAFAVLLLGPYFLLAVFPSHVSQAGLFLALSPLGMMLAAVLCGYLLTRFNAQQICQLGSLLLTAGLCGIAYWDEHSSLSLMAVTLLLQGLGLGLVQVATMDFVMATLPRNAQGVAGSLVMLMRTIGVVSGASIAAILFQRWSIGSKATILDDEFVSAFSNTFWCMAGVSATAFILLISITIWRGNDNYQDAN